MHKVTRCPSPAFQAFSWLILIAGLALGLLVFPSGLFSVQSFPRLTPVLEGTWLGATLILVFLGAMFKLMRAAPQPILTLDGTYFLYLYLAASRIPAPAWLIIVVVELFDCLVLRRKAMGGHVVATLGRALIIVTLTRLIVILIAPAAPAPAVPLIATVAFVALTVVYNIVSPALNRVANLGAFVTQTLLPFDVPRYFATGLLAWPLMFAESGAALGSMPPSQYMMVCGLLLLLALVFSVWQGNQSVEQDIIMRLTSLLDARDQYASSHSHDVMNLGVSFATYLKWSPYELYRTKLACLLHDVGNAYVPAEIFRKPSHLTPDEYTQIKEHVTRGKEIILEVLGLKHVADFVGDSHEWWNGGGYPRGAKGAEIALPARLIMLVDSYYAMTADRPYRAGMPQEKALRIIEEETGRQFEPDLAKRFIEFMREGEVDLELVQFHPHLGV